MDEYVYSPLPPAPSIRLLFLHPSRAVNDSLRCGLAELPFTAATALNYHALSYVWGSTSPENMESIQVLSKGQIKGRIRITRNCANALRHLRQRLETRIMWVDAICIDQTSNVEKGQQVPIMDKIYFHAAQVKVWFDLGSLDGIEAKETLTFFNFLGYLWSIGYLRFHGDDKFRRPVLSTTLCERWCDRKGKQLSETIYFILTNEYFSRAWTVQEWVLPLTNKIAIHSQFGNTTAHALLVAQQFLWKLELLMSRDNDARLMAIRGANLTRFDPPNSTSSDQLEKLILDDGGRLIQNETADIILNIHALKASNPRDKAYANLWALIIEIEPVKMAKYPIFQVDYTKSVELVYTEFTMAAIKICNSVSALYLASSPGKNENLPSWVPDWNRPAHSGGSFDFLEAFLSTNISCQAGGLSNPKTEIDFTDNKMHISGVSVSKVLKCIEIPERAFSVDERAYPPPNLDTHINNLHKTFHQIFEEIDRFSLEITKSMDVDSFLKQLVNIFGIDHNYPQLTTMEKRIESEFRVDIRVSRMRILHDLVMSWKFGPIDRYITPAALDQWARGLRAILHDFFTDSEIIRMLKKCRTVSGTPFGIILLLGQLCENVICFRETINQVDFGFCWGKTIIFTTDGKIGVAYTAKPGDDVVVWKGLKCPVVLRKSNLHSPENESWNLVSIAWVNGMMQGEEFKEDELIRFEVI